MQAERLGERVETSFVEEQHASVKPAREVGRAPPVFAVAPFTLLVSWSSPKQKTKARSMVSPPAAASSRPVAVTHCQWASPPGRLPPGAGRTTSTSASATPLPRAYHRSCADVCGEARARQRRAS
jgi:hypothetical protein